MQRPRRQADVRESSYYGERSPHRALVAAVDECAELLSAMSAEEVEGVLEDLHPVYRDWVGKAPSGGSDTEYLKRLSTYYLAMVLAERDRSLAGVLNVDLSESRVLEPYPELEDRFDDGGLLRIGEGTTIMDHGILYRDHILHLHQFLRGVFSSSSNPNADLMWRFGQYFKESGETNEFRVAVDHSRLMPKEAYAVERLGKHLLVERGAQPEQIHQDLLGRYIGYVEHRDQVLLWSHCCCAPDNCCARYATRAFTDPASI